MKNKVRLLTIMSFIISILPFAVYYCIYPNMQSIVFIHYNIEGIVDRFVSKGSIEILMSCGIGFFIFIFMYIINLLFIKIPKNAEEDNSDVIKLLVNIVAFYLVVIFSGASIYYLLTTTGAFKFKLLNIIEISNILLGLLSINFGYYISKFKRNNAKAQKHCKTVWISGGIIMIISSVILGNISLIISLSISSTILIIMFILSAMYRQNQMKKL